MGQSAVVGYIGRWNKRINGSFWIGRYVSAQTCEDNLCNNKPTLICMLAFVTVSLLYIYVLLLALLLLLLHHREERKGERSVLSLNAESFAVRLV
jgi:hypothetical protein